MIDFELKVPRRISSHKNYSKLNEGKFKLTQISFVSYAESLKGLSQSLLPNQKDKFRNMFYPFIHVGSDFNEMNELLIKDRRDESVSNFQKSRSRFKTQKIYHNFIDEAHDESEKSNPNFSNQMQEINAQDTEFEAKQFTHDERQSLKNAFRYICRLVFKQAHKYSDKMSQIYPGKKQAHNNSHLQQEKQPKRSRREKSSLSICQATLSQLNLLQEAELISGERYFKQFLQKLQNSQRKILLKYMIWFLRTKYLRYINKCNNENKGKRKQMKKDLYIRFKNVTMLPYLQALLIDISGLDIK